MGNICGLIPRELTAGPLERDEDCMSVALHSNRRRALLHRLHRVLHLEDYSYVYAAHHHFVWNHNVMLYIALTSEREFYDLYLMESALRAPDGDIAVILIPEHHQAHKELCKDKQVKEENLFLSSFLG